MNDKLKKDRSPSPQKTTTILEVHTLQRPLNNQISNSPTTRHVNKIENLNKQRYVLSCYMQPLPPPMQMPLTQPPPPPPPPQPPPLLVDPLFYAIDYSNMKSPQSRREVIIEKLKKSFKRRFKKFSLFFYFMRFLIIVSVHY